MLTSANVHDSQEFESVVQGDYEMVLTDKAYCGAGSAEKLRDAELRLRLVFKETGQAGKPILLPAFIFAEGSVGI